MSWPREKGRKGKGGETWFSTFISFAPPENRRTNKGLGEGGMTKGKGRLSISRRREKEREGEAGDGSVPGRAEKVWPGREGRGRADEFPFNPGQRRKCGRGESEGGRAEGGEQRGKGGSKRAR